MLDIVSFVFLPEVCGALREKIESPKYSLIPGYKYSVSHYTPLLLALPFWHSVWTSAGVYLPL